MSNIAYLLDRYRKHPEVERLVRFLQTKTHARAQLSGLTGAQASFVLAATATQGLHLFIANTKEDAAYALNNLAGVLGDAAVHFFPDSFKRPAYFDHLNATQVLQRSELVNKMSQGAADLRCIVAYPEALFEKVVRPDVLSRNRIEVVVGARLDIDFIIEVLVEYGFERTDFVYEPGQFSIRGGIVDLFSYGNELPYRIELFGDEVETIRLFDPMTQLSRQNIGRVSIVPNLNTRFEQNQKVSLLEVLPENTVLWVHNVQFLLDRLQYCFDRAEQFAVNLNSLEEPELREIFRDRAFLYPGQVADDIQARTLVFTDRQGKQTEEAFGAPEKFTFFSKPQPSFNKQFDLLIRHLHENKAGGYETFVFSDNPRQLERLGHIFRDLKAETEWSPVEIALSEGFIDETLHLACLTDHQIFQRHHHFKLRTGFSKEQALNIRLLRELQPGDFVTHIDHGIGRFSGLQKIEIGGQAQESVRLFYKNNDILYVSIHSLHKISKYLGRDGEEPQLSKLGSDAWKQLKARTKKKIKDIAADLIKLYAKRRAAPGHQFPPDSYLQDELEASFMYEDTPDQFKATQDVKADMEKPYPMDRLICGDVGFGKTEVAIRAAFKAVTDGKQVAVLVPTTILALQHWKTFSDRLKDFAVTVDYLNRFRSAKEKKEIAARLKTGAIDIVIGTHALLTKDIAFKDLGLLIVDEEQKFGVAAKEKLRALQVSVDTLTLTATPIPRTLQFSLMAARDLSVIRTPPPNRQPIHTEIRVHDEELIKDAIYYEVHRGGQVFFVHNRVTDLPRIAEMLHRLCPDVDIAMAHGQLDAEKLEQVLIDFIERRFDVLVCTNIIETGLDIPNANTILINRADMFGLSDLHQLRGRVGRSNAKAFCYLLAPPTSVLTQEARRRLRTIEEFSDLGSGFQVAMRDLDIRGAGNMLGGEQSGFIADIGYDTYQKILEEAIRELKETDFKDLFKDEIAQKGDYVRDVIIETDVEMLIPDDYVTNTQERLNLYTELDTLETEEDVDAYAKRLEDRFGKLPAQVNALFEALRLRWLCKKLGFERLILKNRKLRCYFLSDPQSSFFETAQFTKLVQFVGAKGRMMNLSMKQTARELILVQDEVRSIREAKRTLEGLVEVVG
ncbi:MAG: transcription-repair coupling factor [Saprospiraceae bacterium]|nr:transcription-repair coupling factor [Saprospiraceae bacterium]